MGGHYANSKLVGHQYFTHIVALNGFQEHNTVCIHNARWLVRLVCAHHDFLEILTILKELGATKARCQAVELLHYHFCMGTQNYYGG